MRTPKFWLISARGLNDLKSIFVNPNQSWLWTLKSLGTIISPEECLEISESFIEESASKNASKKMFSIIYIITKSEKEDMKVVFHRVTYSISHSLGELDADISKDLRLVHKVVFHIQAEFHIFVYLSRNGLSYLSDTIWSKNFLMFMHTTYSSFIPVVNVGRRKLVLCYQCF